ncbi:hypothetical protein GQR58_029174 [Nymphon striatum]|nr:hypothetical protein GQR58_029174 [Nymphon striatum]
MPTECRVPMCKNSEIEQGSRCFEEVANRCFIDRFEVYEEVFGATIRQFVQQCKDKTYQQTHNVPGQFLMAALDNLNFHSETEDGGNVDATTNIIYQYSSGEETADCVVRVPYDPKVRRRTIQMAEKFQPVSSELTLKERKEARSLRSVDLSDADIGDRP